MYRIIIKDKYENIIESYFHKSMYFATMKYSKMLEKYVFKNIAEGNSYSLIFSFYKNNSITLISKTKLNSK